MTFRDDVRKHFEHEAARDPAPRGLQGRALAEARVRSVDRRRPQWIAGAVAILLAVAIVAGLLAANSLRRNHETLVPSNPPKLLFIDKLTAVAAGRPSLPSRTGKLNVQRYVLAATLPSTPAAGKVYLIDPTQAPAATAIAVRFGITAPPKQVSNDEFDVGNLQYFPSTGTVNYSSPGNGSLDPAEPITDKASAIKSAGNLLVTLGLFSRGELATMPASAKRFSYPSNPPFWSIQFVRTLDTVAVDEFWSGAGASLQIQEAGGVELLSVSRPSIAGSQPASLIDSATAWQQISLGHAFSLSGLINNGPSHLASFRADKAELCYYDEAGLWIVPMWCFRDTTTLGVDYPMWLFYPAMTPGNFDWTAPLGG
jgi:hypothetical protein